MSTSHRGIYPGVKKLLVKAGWRIDPNPREAPSEEPLEFIHPYTGEAMTWLEAQKTQLYDLER